ncbi:hypothetical protein BC940DRAFT_245952 [Gongronella butleri]|nr:hypothetical protein BC940DRAFT_245952 [Gongronella butleri]
MAAATPAPACSAPDSTDTRADLPVPATPSSHSLSKKKRKRAERYTLAELKQLASNPDVVHALDPCSPDPLLLVDLKACRNTVPVPKHWSYAHKYLTMHPFDTKPAYELPDYIKQTGVMEMRDQLKRQEHAKKQKARTRAQRRGKLSTLALDYDDMHDAFFKHQTKSKLTRHGELFYENKGFHDAMQQLKPGSLSPDLREALGMTTELSPPPWLHAMQRYGPPPAYAATMTIPGLNAPIPPGAMTGFQAQEWGKIPVDELGRPLYGFKVEPNAHVDKTSAQTAAVVDKSWWGELEDAESDTSEGEEDDDAATVDQGEPQDTPLIEVDVQQELELGKAKSKHKRNQGKEMMTLDATENAKHAFYTILPEKATTTTKTQWMGSQHAYDIPPVSISRLKKRPSWSAPASDVTIALEPREMTDDPHGLPVAMLQDKFDQAQAARVPRGAGQHDLQQMVVDHEKHRAKRKRSVHF